jgi:hypothetical protein
MCKVEHAAFTLGKSDGLMAEKQSIEMNVCGTDLVVSVFHLLKTALNDALKEEVQRLKMTAGHQQMYQSMQRISSNSNSAENVNAPRQLQPMSKS